MAHTTIQGKAVTRSYFVPLGLRVINPGGIKALHERQGVKVVSLSDGYIERLSC